MPTTTKEPVSEFWRSLIDAHVETTLARVGTEFGLRRRADLVRACPFRRGSRLGQAWWAEIARQRMRAAKKTEG